MNYRRMRAVSRNRKSKDSGGSNSFLKTLRQWGVFIDGLKIYMVLATFSFGQKD